MLSNGRATIESTYGTLKIRVPAKRNWFSILFLPMWLVGLIFAFNMTGQIEPTNQTGEANNFITIWIVGWSIGGVFALYYGLWSLFGMERFESENGVVTFQKSIFGVGRKRTFNATDLSGFRTDFTIERDNEGNTVHKISGGKIKFDWGMKTFAFGHGVDEAEATHIVGLMNTHFGKK